MATNMAAAAAPPSSKPYGILTLFAAPPASEPVVAAAVWLKAWMPNVVPVKTAVDPPLVIVVVIVAGTGALVVVEQPDHVPVQELNGPHPAVHVVQLSQFMPEAFVPQGPKPPGPKPPGPPDCPQPP